MPPLREIAPPGTFAPLARVPPAEEHRAVGLDWDDLRFVLALRRAGSLGAAARLLKVEQSTASRRLTALESALGAQLVARTPEGLALNEAGQLVADLAQSIDGGVEELLRRIGGEDQRPEGLVRLSTSESFCPFLMGGLVPLRQEHPKIQVQLVVSSAALDLMRRDADVALRLFRETNHALVTRKIGVIGWSVYASQAYVDRTGFALKDLSQDSPLAGQAVVGYAGAPLRSTGSAWLLEHCRAEDIVLTGESVPSVMNAVRAGIGVSVLPCFAAHGNPSLVRLTPAVVAQTEAFLVIPPDHRNTVRVRLVMDAVTALFERERALLAG
jgi:DNA-binding transcriptional LysR family regulator